MWQDLMPDGMKLTRIMFFKKASFKLEEGDFPIPQTTWVIYIAEKWEEW